MRWKLGLAIVTLGGLGGGCSPAPRDHLVEDRSPSAVASPKCDETPSPAEPPKCDEKPPTSWREQALEFVRLGYGEDHDHEFRSLSFRTEALDTDTAKEAVMLVAQYNAFEGVRVAAAIEQLRGDVTNYEFGREGSPVLYVHLPYWTNQQERNCPAHHCREGQWGDRQSARKLEASEHAALLERVRAAFEGARADEIDPVSETEHELRIWWD